MSSKQKKAPGEPEAAKGKAASQEEAGKDQAQEEPRKTAPEGAAAPEQGQVEQAAPPGDDGEQKLRQAEDKFLRLAAEYDNYRKRTAKEKESAWLDSKVQTVGAFLPVYDNLERALKQECADEAYAKGVEMTMKGLRDVLSKLDVEMIPALGEVFDPNRHNAVMHVDDESAGENTIVEVFQQGFMCGERVIRFAMVKVAN